MLHHPSWHQRTASGKRDCDRRPVCSAGHLDALYIWGPQLRRTLTFEALLKSLAPTSGTTQSTGSSNVKAVQDLVSHSPTGDFGSSGLFGYRQRNLILTSLWCRHYTATGASVEEICGRSRNARIVDVAVSRLEPEPGAVFLCIQHVMIGPGILFRGGRVVDPSSGLDGPADVRVRGSVITEIGCLEPEPQERTIELDGLVVAPGFIDVHTHLREPGQEWKETIGSGTAAAAAGGFTTVFCMPNTEPALDSVAAIELLRQRIVHDAVVKVWPIATISEGRRGHREVDYDALVTAGVVGFSDDGESTSDSGVMRAALSAAARAGRPVMVHCEDSGLASGPMAEGDISRELGISGSPAAAEEVGIARDIALAALTQGWLHVCHVSTANGAAQVAVARRRGVPVTFEVMPHHLTMADSWVGGDRQLVNAACRPGILDRPANPITKVNPPLRPADDARALLAAMKRDQTAIVATDHAPHAWSEKHGRPYHLAAYGFSGSEFALPLMLELVRAGHLTLGDVVARMSTIPARLWKLDAGSLMPGAPADIIAFDPNQRWTVLPRTIVSRGTNTPLLETELQGRVKMTFVNGDLRYRD
jgi:dihydroorotase